MCWSILCWFWFLRYVKILCETLTQPVLCWRCVADTAGDDEADENTVSSEDAQLPSGIALFNTFYQLLVSECLTGFFVFLSGICKPADDELLQQRSRS